MKLFKLKAKVTVTAYTKVNAETLEEAIKIAEKREPIIDRIGLGPVEYWVVEDADGMPYDISEVY